MKNWCYILRSRAFILCAIICGIIVIISVCIVLIVNAFSDSLTSLEKAEKLLAKFILFDGHNDFPTNARLHVRNDLRLFNFSQNLSTSKDWDSNEFSKTDLYRLRTGGVKAQFWVARAECQSQFKDAAEIVFEQIDVIKRIIANYSSEMVLATSYDEIMNAVADNKIASLITICCGHSIQWSFAILRLLYELGVRSMTLVPAMCSTPWGDSAAVDRPNVSTRMRVMNTAGLSSFGTEVVVEMNRLGMIVDISESSIGTMKEVLFVSKAPVIFSHAAARGICDNEKNIPDDVLKLVRQNEALIMVSFYPSVLRCDGGNVTIADVVKHLEYLRERTTIENLGIGSDFDAVDAVTEGLEDVSKFPNLFAALIDTGRWSDADLEKLAGQNMLRVLQEVESVRDQMQDVPPRQSWIKFADLKKMGFDGSCSTAHLIEQPPSQVDMNKFSMPKDRNYLMEQPPSKVDISKFGMPKDRNFLMEQPPPQVDGPKFSMPKDRNFLMEQPPPQVDMPKIGMPKDKNFMIDYPPPPQIDMSKFGVPKNKNF